jgi:hypothetical protein
MEEAFETGELSTLGKLANVQVASPLFPVKPTPLMVRFAPLALMALK